MPNFRITEQTKICSLHFKADYFRKSLTGRRTLKDEAIPLIFAWSNPSPKRKSPRKRPFEIPSQDANKCALAMPFEDEIDVQLEPRVPPNENDLKKIHKATRRKKQRSLPKSRRIDHKAVWNREIQGVKFRHLFLYGIS